MRRAIITAGSAALGAAGVVLLAPHGLSPASASSATTPSTDQGSAGTAGDSSPSGTSGSSSGSSGSSGTSGSSSGSSGSSSGSGSGSSGGSQTVAGDTVTDRWGPVQVEITVAQGTISDITLLQLPSDGRSRWINDQAVPILVSQALQAQSASIDGVSGATDTTRAFVQSLSSALQKANL